MRRRASVRQYELVDAHFLRQSVECFALHEFGACIGEEALAFARKVAVDDVAHGSVENGVAQKFQSFVVHRLALGVALEHAFVHECQLIVADVVRIEAYDLA